MAIHKNILYIGCPETKPNLVTHQIYVADFLNQQNITILLNRINPDICLVDNCIFKHKTTEDFLSRLRKEYNGPIFIVVNDNAVIKYDYIKMGADDYIMQKSLNQEELERAFRRYKAKNSFRENLRTAKQLLALA